MPPKTPPGGTPRPDRPPAARNDHREAFQRGTTVSSPEDQMAKAAALEEALEALRIHFEQYFLGLVRRPPTQERAAVRGAILQLKSSFVRNTAVKFRVHSLHNRYLSYERMWDRTIREMEDGTYRRDLFKARLHRSRTGGDPAASTAEALRRAEAIAREASETAGDFDVDEVPEGDEADGARLAAAVAAAGGRPSPAGSAAPVPGPAARPAGPVSAPDLAARPAAPAVTEAAVTRPPPAVTPPPPSAVAPRPAGGGAGLPDEARIRELHRAYVEARRQCRENIDGLTFDAVAAALRKQVPALLEKHRARSIDFQVVIQNGKAILKAFPR